MTKLVIDNVIIRPDKDESEIKNYITRKYNLTFDFMTTIIRKSLDARKKQDIVYRYRVVIDVPDEAARRLLTDKDVSEYTGKQDLQVTGRINGLKICIIGSGPAGLFSALRLIEAGAVVEIFERGKPVQERINDICKLEGDGILNEESNVVFGEGGAGTYSDGKLTTRINRPEINWFFSKLIEFGAPDSIMYESKPHLGTDKLHGIITGIRNYITSKGSKINFNECLTDISIKNGSITEIKTSGDIQHDCSILILAIGHSSRDTYQMLHDQKIFLEKKGFAVGVRIEHPAEYIRSMQYGSSPYGDMLPAAEYNLAYNNKSTGRGIYTFCMCPGGKIVNSSSEKDGLCTNGMSYSQRNMHFSNSAIVVTVTKDDLDKDALSGLKFQQNIEKAAFKAGGGNFKAPAQTMQSFLKGTMDKILPEASFQNGIVPYDLSKIFPQYIINELKTGISQFNKRMKGFILENAVLTGPETRTSSPVRIVRGSDFQSLSAKGLYPVGEGAGYAGGIVSSAIDGIRAADMIIEQYGNTN